MTVYRRFGGRDAATPPEVKHGAFRTMCEHAAAGRLKVEYEEMPLDESLQLFEEGIRLSRFCHQRLEEVEKKIELILADAKGQPVTEPFEEDELEEEAPPE